MKVTSLICTCQNEASYFFIVTKCYYRLKNMKIGDRVRFLSDVGGGIIKGFQGKNIVLVEDEDGFQMPVLATDVVVVTTDDYNIAKVDTMGRNQKPQAVAAPPSAKATDNNYEADEEDIDPADRPITYKPKPEERADGDKLSVFLSFVPVNPKAFSTTTFECYLVNDCNYFIHYIYLSKENNTYQLRAQGMVEPNTKVFVEELDHSMLNAIERVGIQFVAYKEDKPFLLKQPVSVDLRIDTTKFFKFHTFRESLFFDEPALEFTIVKDDVLPRSFSVNPQELQKAMIEKNDNTRVERQQARVSKKSNVHEVIEVDLHAHELLETTSGMSAADIKEYQLGVFRKTLDAHIKHKGQRIVFIHGKGEGVLRNAMIQELKHKYKNCSFQDASFQQYGFGATMVIVH